MSELDSERELQTGKALLVIRIVGLAIMAGVLVFSGVVYFLKSSGTFTGAGPDLPFPLAALGLALCVPAVAASFVIKGVLWRAAKGQDLKAQLAAYTRGTIVAMALCEGPGMIIAAFALVAPPDELPWLAGVALPLVSMTLHFPNRVALDAHLDAANRL
ncbi:MAG: hypothetical protein L6R28_15945 [Planctomycetes bacterium]|nr:hypothetical protein [Planctomycetota bacterium]